MKLSPHSKFGLALFASLLALNAHAGPITYTYDAAGRLVEHGADLYAKDANGLTVSSTFALYSQSCLGIGRPSSVFVSATQLINASPRSSWRFEIGYTTKRR